MRPRTRFITKIIGGVAVCALVLYLTSAMWLREVGAFLIDAGPPAKADLAVVLAGDNYGHRIERGAELVREGYVPRVLVSGPHAFYGEYESTLAIAYAERAGYPRSYFQALPHAALSTRDEVRVIADELRREHVKSVDIVTSNFHTRRSAYLFRRAAPDVEFHMVASRDEYFRPDSWWRDREAQKIVFFEWSKTIATWLGK